MGDNIKCRKCESESFVIDNERTGYYPPDPMPPMKIDGITELTYKTYIKCQKCGWEWPDGFIMNIEESVTLIFEIKDKK